MLPRGRPRLVACVNKLVYKQLGLLCQYFSKLNEREVDWNYEQNLLWIVTETCHVLLVRYFRWVSSIFLRPSYESIKPR